MESKEEIYRNDFEIFLSHTNEKEILFDEIKRIIAYYGIKSVLDIGAGNGLLSIPLSKQVEEYVAIEPNTKFTPKLREAEIEVIEEEFPTEIHDRFDMVLASHSISYRNEKYIPFIEKAWELVKPNGTLVIITYRGLEDDWTKLIKELGMSQENDDVVAFGQITKLLSSFGNVEIEKVITKVRTDNLDDMIKSLSFVASDGKQERKDDFLVQRDKIEHIIVNNYQDENGYSFPFQHFLIITQKGDIEYL